MSNRLKLIILFGVFSIIGAVLAWQKIQNEFPIVYKGNIWYNIQCEVAESFKGFECSGYRELGGTK